MTAFYMFRQLFMTFYGECRADHHTQEHLHESPSVMTMPLVVLAVGAVFAGFIGLPAVLGRQPVRPLARAGDSRPRSEHASHALEWGLMALSVGVASLGLSSSPISCTGAEAHFAGNICQSGRRSFLSIVRPQMVLRRDLQVLFVNGTLLTGATFLSAFDAYIVDGIVNGVGER